MPQPGLMERVGPLLTGGRGKKDGMLLFLEIGHETRPETGAGRGLRAR